MQKCRFIKNWFAERCKSGLKFIEKSCRKIWSVSQECLTLHRKSKKANAKIAQLVEYDLAKVGVAGSSPVFRSKEKENIKILADILLCLE